MRQIGGEVLFGKSRTRQSAGLQHTMLPEAGNASNELGFKKCPRATQRIALAETVLAAELVDPAAGIDNFLLTGIERVTGRANLDCEVFTEGAACGEFVATTTGHLDFAVIGMDVGFHFDSTFN
jgi:hypothetical protein